jgi:APA family basic amino acid/polyamine antiporter
MRTHRRSAVSDEHAPPLGFWMATALVVGNMVGSGVFLLPAALAPLGLNSVAGWGVSASGALLLAVVLAALSRAFPDAGGPFAYTRAAFGDLAGFLVAWGYWVSVWVGNAAIATGGVSYLTPIAPWIGTSPLGAALVTIGMLWALTLVNAWGVRAAGRVQAATTMLKLVPLVAVAIIGLFFVRRDVAAQVAAVPLSLDATTAAATLAMWALLGFESATVPADKVRDPARTIPRATLVGTAVAAIVCAVACTVVVFLVPAEQLAASTAPFADAARPFWGERAAVFVGLAAAVSTFGCLNGWILLQGELPRVLARAGAFPRAFARESARGTPVVALVFTSLLVTLLVLANARRGLVGVFTFMILLSTCANLVAYLACGLAVLALLRHGRMGPAPRGAPWLALAGVLGSAYCLWALAGAGREALQWGAVLLAAGLPVYLTRRGRPRTEN